MPRNAMEITRSAGFGICLAVAVLIGLVSGCGVNPAPGTATKSSTPAAREFKPIAPTVAKFWDRQVTETAQILQDLTAEFNKTNPGLPVEPEYIGGYSDIYRKVSASIQAGALPAMAVAYESMTAEYVQAGAVLALDSLASDSTTGFTREQLDDFFPAVLETNRYPDFDGRMYSFPFCKSVLMMYFNKRVLADAGVAEEPKTWTAFLDACRQIKAKTGKQAYAVSVDCSTIDGMIFSLGGDVVKGRETLFDSPQALKVFELFETFSKEQLAYQIPPKSEDDKAAFVQDRVAFVFRSSSHRANLNLLMEGNKERWGMAMIPQGDPQDPHTVLYGPNIVIFNTTPEQQRKAWDFVKYFTSPEITARWAVQTGYMPIRKSAAENPGLKAFWAEWTYNRAAFDCLPSARTEPNLAGWQEVRDLVEKAQSAVLSGTKSAKDATAELKRNADAVLKGQ